MASGISVFTRRSSIGHRSKVTLRARAQVLTRCKGKTKAEEAFKAQALSPAASATPAVQLEQILPPEQNYALSPLAQIVDEAAAPAPQSPIAPSSDLAFAVHFWNTACWRCRQEAARAGF